MLCGKGGKKGGVSSPFQRGGGEFFLSGGLSADFGQEAAFLRYLKYKQVVYSPPTHCPACLETKTNCTVLSLS